jgi:hypothetical protein
MIEVFKTNIHCAEKAKQLLELIHASFANYRANFDLEDCDRILRVVADKEHIGLSFIDWLKHFECHAEILPDN